MTWRNRNLYLIGLPGAGKSAIGGELASLLREHSYSFLDLDSEIERIACRSIPSIFSTLGEAAFRNFETAALKNAADDKSRHYVVATGGGIVMNPLNRSIMRGSGIPIWIDVTVREAVKNVLADFANGIDRPLLRAASHDELEATMRALLEIRRPYYEEATLHFVSRSPRGDIRTPSELAMELLMALDEMSFKVLLTPRFKTIVAKSALRDYPILVGSGCALRELVHSIRETSAKTIVTITDTNVGALHGEELHAKLTTAFPSGYSFHTLTIRAGEGSKNRETLFDLLSTLSTLNAGRKDILIVAMGGGVVTDLAGFAASIYNRGVKVIHIPTTLLAQADAAIGGKTGIDFDGKKNLVGTFYPPTQVLVDPLFLKTLPQRELHAALGEVFKYALIGSRTLWEELSSKVGRLVRGVDGAYAEIIHESIIQKLRYVEADEFERASGVRELLNFGHTFGHALESATGFHTVLHGEAVLLGMRAAAWLSKEMGYISIETWQEIEQTLGRIPIEVRVQCEASAVLNAFKHDKKRQGVNRVILLRAIGEAFVREILDEDATRAIEFMLSLT